MIRRLTAIVAIATSLAGAHGCSSAPDSSSVVAQMPTGEGGSGASSGASSGSGSGTMSGSSSGGPSTTGSSGAVADSGPPASCDAALPIPGDAGGACTACKQKNCASTLAQCQADCNCNPIEVCLEEIGGLFLNQCPNAVAASLGGNQPLTMLIQCVDTNCLTVCSASGASDGGGDGGQGGG